MDGDDDALKRSAGEPQAFVAFYDRHSPGVLAFFARATLDADAAADLTAETFAQAFASRRRYRGPNADAWLYAIARHQLARYWRRRRVDRRTRERLGIPLKPLSSEDHERVEELIDFERVGRAVAQALGGLPRRQREAVRLKVIEGQSYEQVAKTLSCSEEAVRARVSRALRRLGTVLEQQG